jgi:hypothetical protein
VVYFYFFFFSIPIRDLSQLRHLVLHRELPLVTEPVRLYFEFICSNKMLYLPVTTLCVFSSVSLGRNYRQTQKAASLRTRIWKVFLQVQPISAQHYISLVRKGPCQQVIFFLSLIAQSLRLCICLSSARVQFGEKQTTVLFTQMPYAQYILDDYFRTFKTDEGMLPSPCPLTTHTHSLSLSLITFCLL